MKRTAQIIKFPGPKPLIEPEPAPPVTLPMDYWIVCAVAVTGIAVVLGVDALLSMRKWY